MSTCTIAFSAVDPTLATLPGAKLVFRPRQEVLRGAGAMIMTPSPVSVVADETGAGTVSLSPGEYVVIMTSSSGSRQANISVPDSAAASLGDLVDAPIGAWEFSALQSLRDETRAWATEAEDVPVQPGLFSAFHWARKAWAWAQAAAQSAITAALYDPTRRYPTVALMEASTRGATAPGTIWQARGSIYQEVTSGPDITTAGGVMLRLIPQSGAICTSDFGIIPDNGTIDYAVRLQAWATAIAREKCNGVFDGTGTIYSSQPIRLPHTGSYYRMDTGLRITAPGAGLILTRKDTGRSNFVDFATVGVVVQPGAGVTAARGEFYKNNTGAAITLTGTAGTRLSATELQSHGLTDARAEAQAEAFLVIHGSNYNLTGLYFRDCKCGIHFGQSPDTAEFSHVSFTNLEDVVVANCSIGIRWRARAGAYYNAIKDCHVFQCQIGYDLGQDLIGVTSGNWNRNLLQNSRAARCQVGWVARANNTNTYLMCTTEGCGDTPTNNRYGGTPIQGLPDAVGSWAWIAEATCSKEVFIRCIDEGADRVFWHSAGETSWIDCNFQENQANRCKLVVVPFRIANQRTTRNHDGAYTFLSNNMPDMPLVPTGHHFIGDVRFQASTIRRHAGVLDTAANKTALTDWWADVGAVASGGTASVTLWASTGQNVEEKGENAVAEFTVNVVGNCQASTMVHWTRFRVIAYRNNSRTLQRYFVLDQAGGRSNGANVGDTTEQFTPSLSVVSGALVLTLTAPARAFDRVSVRVGSHFVRT